MDFKGYYDNLIFDVDNPLLKVFKGKQGDTKSRGINVTITQKNVTITDLADLSLRFFYKKPDGTRGFIDAVKADNKFMVDYTNQVYAVPGVVKAELRLSGADGEIISNKTFKIVVDASIADGSIVSKNERGILDQAFELAEDIIPRIELLDVELLENIQTVLPLEVAKIKKELSDYKTVMAGLNPNQEAKQQATGYGIVSLPKNAANGQVSGVVKGFTATNLVVNGDFSLGDEGWTFASLQAAKVFSFTDQMRISGTATTTGGYYQDINGNTDDQYYVGFEYIHNNGNDPKVTIRNYGTWDNAREVTLSQKSGTKSIIVSNNVDGIRLYFQLQEGNSYDCSIDNIIAINLTATFGEGNEPTKEECDQIFANWFDGTKSTVCAGRITCKNEDETEQSQLYYVAKDPETGEILEARSVPNGTKDEINVTDRKLIKRIGEKSNIANGMVIDFADMAEGGTYYAWNEDGETETGIKGDTLGIDATTLTYQLAESIEIPVQVSGNIVSHPSGTVYIDHATFVVGVYGDNMTVTHSDLPIRAINKITRIDYQTGLEYELDVSKAVIATDGLSYTHPDLQSGDIVFFDYDYDVESTDGETTIEYYDSRYTIKDSVTGKFYKWEVSVSNGTPSITLVEV